MFNRNESVKYFPLDVTQLVKGQVIGIEEIESLSGVLYSNPHYAMKGPLWLQAKIIQQRKRLGLPYLTMKIRKGTLIICDDEGSLKQNEKHSKSGKKKIRRAVTGYVTIDAGNLTPDQRERLTKNMLRDGRNIAAINSNAHIKLLPTVQQRQTPGLPAPEKT